MDMSKSSTQAWETYALAQLHDFTSPYVPTYTQHKDRVHYGLMLASKLHTFESRENGTHTMAWGPGMLVTIPYPPEHVCALVAQKLDYLSRQPRYGV